MTDLDDQTNDAELEKVRGEVQKQEGGYRLLLLPLLRDLSPLSSDDAHEQACRQIAASITKFKHALKAAPHESLRAIRKELRQRKAALEGCVAVIEAEPNSLTAKVAFNLALLRTPGSLRELKKQLVCAIAAADAALSSFEGKAPRQGDWHIAELSAELTLTMRRLGLRPLATSDTYTKPEKRGTPTKSAGLARLLRTAMKLAGAQPPDDLRYFMVKGFELARRRGVYVTKQFELNGGFVHLIDREIFDSK